MIEITPGPDASFRLHRNGEVVAESRVLLWVEGTPMEATSASSTPGDQKVRVTYTVEKGGTLTLELSLTDLGDNAWGLHFLLANAGQNSLALTRLRWEVHLPASVWADPLWTMQGAAVGWGQDFAFPLEEGFARDNYLGHLQDAEGGGVPVAYCWNREHGLAIMHLERTPLEWYMPVARDARGVVMAFERRTPLPLGPGETWESPSFALSWHQGSDFFAPLARYREWLAQRGLRPAPPVRASYDPAWCSW